MKRILPFIPITLIAWCCTTSELVTPTAGDKSLSYPDLNVRLAKDDVHIKFVDGRQTVGTGLRLEADSSSWVDTKTGTVVKVPTATIDKIETKRRLVGGLLGLGAGLGTGALVGYNTGSSNQPHGDVGNGWAMLGYTAGGALVGGLVGTIVGVTIGTTAGYQIANDSTHHIK